MAEHRFLLADLGGTNTRVALADDSGLIPDTVRAYTNRAHRGLIAVLRTYLADMHPGPLEAICAGVAGPVRDGTAQLTNCDWFIEANELAEATGVAHVFLINDLQAQGHALDDLPPGSVTPLFQPRQAAPKAPRLVMNLGTGCNVAVVHRIGTGLFVPAAESGHTALPQASGHLARLFTSLRENEPHLPVEAVLSGRGLSAVHRFATGETCAPEEIVSAIAQGAAGDTLQLFTETLGMVAGNMALHHMARGGLFLSGGLGQALGAYMPAEAFLPAFTAKGPYRHIAESIPVSLITAPHFALLGCARYARECYLK